MRDRERVVQHRAQRRNPGPARDEDEPALGRGGWKCEGSMRAVDIHSSTALELKMRPRRAIGVDADEELEASFAPRLFWRGRDRVRPLRSAGGAHQNRLSGGVIECRAVQPNPDDARARRGGEHLPDGQREEHGGLC